MDFKNQKVKIVATLGPSTEEVSQMVRIANAGVRIVRVNFSHITRFEEAEKLVKNIRRAEVKVRRHIATLADIAGPKIRIGEVEKGTELHTGKKVEIISQKVIGNRSRISLNYPKLLKNIFVGAEIYLGDGNIKLQAHSRTKNGIIARVLVGGMLRSRMGFSVQGISRPTGALSQKDIRDIGHAVRLKFDAIAVSFVENKNDILRVRRALPKVNPPLIFAKMETARSIKNAAEILDAADGLLIARGDLGFSVSLSELPFIQKELIQLGLKKSKPVITATQMLESMIISPYPTRAEVTDITNAILDGTDAVMLSAETATGKFPEEVVSTMRKIIDRASESVTVHEFPEDHLIADAVSAGTVHTADQVGAKLIVVFTESGATARRIARHRPHQPIIALTPNEATYRKLRFSWGVFPYRIPQVKNFEDLVKQSHHAVKKNRILQLKNGELFVISAGIPLRKSGTTNMALVQRVGK